MKRSLEEYLASNPDGILRLEHPPTQDALQALCKTQGWRLYEVALTAQNERALLVELGRQLAFPPHYGANWDALFDCLGDAAFNPQGCMVAVRGTHTLAVETATTLVELLEEVQALWIADHRPFWVLWSP